MLRVEPRRVELVAEVVVERRCCAGCRARVLASRDVRRRAEPARRPATPSSVPAPARFVAHAELEQRGQVGRRPVAVAIGLGEADVAAEQQPRAARASGAATIAACGPALRRGRRRARRPAVSTVERAALRRARSRRRSSQRAGEPRGASVRARRRSLGATPARGCSGRFADGSVMALPRADDGDGWPARAGCGCRRTPLSQQAQRLPVDGGDDLQREQRMADRRRAAARASLSGAPAASSAAMQHRAVGVVRGDADAQAGALGRGGSTRKS